MIILRGEEREDSAPKILVTYNKQWESARNREKVRKKMKNVVSARTYRTRRHTVYSLEKGRLHHCNSSVGEATLKATLVKLQVAHHGSSVIKLQSYPWRIVASSVDFDSTF